MPTGNTKIAGITNYKALRKKDIRINNIKTSENCTVYENDEITVFINDEFLYK